MRKLKRLFTTGLCICYLSSQLGDLNTIKKFASEILYSISEAHIVSSSKNKITEGTIVRVVDGDTYVINVDEENKTVRLIGVDTPESVSRDKKNNTSYGEKASKHMKKKLPKGTEVELEYDKEKQDIYGRDLAYVYAENKNGTKYMVNKHLLKKGYARAVYYKPNSRYRKDFKELHLKAKKNRKGFWGTGKTSAVGFKKAFPEKTESTY